MLNILQKFFMVQNINYPDWNNLPWKQILQSRIRVYEQIQPERGWQTLHITSEGCWQVALTHLSSFLSAFKAVSLGLLVFTVLRDWWGCEGTAELRWPLSCLYLFCRKNLYKDQWEIFSFITTPLYFSNANPHGLITLWFWGIHESLKCSAISKNALKG